MPPKTADLEDVERGEDLQSTVQKQVDERWSNAVFQRNMELGSRTLAYITIFALVTRFMYWLLYFCDDVEWCPGSFQTRLNMLQEQEIPAGARRECTQSEWESVRYSRWLTVPVALLEIAGLATCLWALKKTAKQPVAKVYFIIVSVWSLYALAPSIPPFRYTCEQRLMKSSCELEFLNVANETIISGNVYSIMSAGLAHNAGESAWIDCLPQGHTSVQTVLAWLVITPRVLPLAAYMRWGHFGIIMGYLAAVVAVNMYLAHKGDSESQPRYSRFRRNVKSTEIIFDIGVALVIVVFAGLYAQSKKRYLEKAQKTKFKWEEMERVLRKDLEEVLKSIVPAPCVPAAMDTEPYAKHCKRSSVLFVRMVGLDETLSSLNADPVRAITFINVHLSSFDTYCENSLVTKIETAGADYICAVGVAELAEAPSHDALLNRLLVVSQMMMHEFTAEDPEFEDIKKPGLAMGLHTGSVITGIAGSVLPRFLMLGETMTIACRMMQTGVPGELHLSSSTQKRLPSHAVVRKREPKVVSYSTFFLDFQKTFGSGSELSSIASQRSAQRTLKQQRSLNSKIQDAQEAMELLSKSSSSGAGALGSSTVGGDVQVASEVSSSMMAEHKQDLGSSSRISASSSTSRGLGGVGEVEIQLSEVHRGSSDSGLRRRGNGESSQPLSPGEALLARSRKTTFDEDSGPSRPLWQQLKEEYAKQHPRRKRNCCEQCCFSFCMFMTCLKNWLGTRIEQGGEQITTLFRKNFSPGWRWDEAEEQQFLEWYHQVAFVKKLRKRLTTQAAVLSFMTCFDMLFTLFFTDAFTAKHLYWDYNRIVVFVMCRFAAFLVVFGWRAICCDDWVSHASGVQKRMLFSYLFIVLMIFLSYDAITVRKDLYFWTTEDGEAYEVPYKLDWNCCEDGENYGRMTSDDIKFQETRTVTRMERRTHAFAVLFVFAFHLASTQVPFLFHHSLFFLALAMAIVVVCRACRFPDLRNLYFNMSTSVLFIGTCFMNVYLSHSNEKNVRQRFRVRNSIKTMADRFQEMQAHVLPPLLAFEGQPPSNEPHAQIFEAATVAKVHLIGLSAFIKQQESAPEVVMEIINSLVEMFAGLAEEHKLWKLDIVGDSIVAAQAEHLTEHHHPLSVVLFALFAVTDTHRWMRHYGTRLTCRVGVHHGPVLGGIIGEDIKRFQFFGKLTSELDVLQATATDGKVQVSTSAKEAVEKQIAAGKLPPYRQTNHGLVLFQERDSTTLKTAKGEPVAVEQAGGPTYWATRDIEEKDRK